MNLRKSEMAILGIVMASFIVSAFFYPHLPEKMASHWNIRGEVDGYSSKLWGLFLVPLVLASVALLLIAIPRIDPLKANIVQFRGYYDGFIILFALLMLSVYLQVILWNLGIQISPNVILPIGLGLFFFYTGILLEHAKRNWFIGIRTPWTLSSDQVWAKTHRVGGRLFKIAGVVALLGVLFPGLALFFVLVPILLVAAYTVVYSYFQYRREAQ